MLTIDHNKRPTAAEIKKHPWFHGIDWANLRKDEAPIIPEQKSDTDTDNFRRMQDVEDKEQNPFAVQRADSVSKEELNQLMKNLRKGDENQFTTSRYDILDLANQNLFEGFK